MFLSFIPTKTIFSVGMFTGVAFNICVKNRGTFSYFQWLAKYEKISTPTKSANSSIAPFRTWVSLILRPYVEGGSQVHHEITCVWKNWPAYLKLMARYIPTNQPPFIRTTTTHKAIPYYQPINITAVGILFQVSLFVIIKQAHLAVLLCGKSPIRILVGTSDMLIGFVSTLSFTSHVSWWCYVVPRLLSSKSFSPGRTPTDTV